MCTIRHDSRVDSFTTLGRVYCLILCSCSRSIAFHLKLDKFWRYLIELLWLWNKALHRRILQAAVKLGMPSFHHVWPDVLESLRRLQRHIILIRLANIVVVVLRRLWVKVLLLHLQVFAHEISSLLVTTVLIWHRRLDNVTYRHSFLRNGRILQVLKRLIQALHLLRLWHVTWILAQILAALFGCLLWWHCMKRVGLLGVIASFEDRHNQIALNK